MYTFEITPLPLQCDTFVYVCIIRDQGKYLERHEMNPARPLEGNVPERWKEAHRRVCEAHALSHASAKQECFRVLYGPGSAEHSSATGDYICLSEKIQKRRTQWSLGQSAQ